ncbi:MAG: GH92 family glycosyl hydrolase [Phycisphaerales bacterium]|nr:GH92 family glycosyl hydrolase [Phycisphaerales bacterium]
MNIITRYIAVLLILTYSNFCSSENLVKYVDPMIGTGWHGHTYPGVTCPFGMVQLSLDNNRIGWDWTSGYHYIDTTIAGFSYTHLSGTGTSDLCDISTLPTYNKKPDTIHYCGSFLHSNEHAQAGYYTVTMNDGITVGLTATNRAGYSVYTFPDNVNPQLQIDLGWHCGHERVMASQFNTINDSLYTGYYFTRGWDQNERVYFALVVSEKPVHIDSIRYLSDKRGVITFLNFAPNTKTVETKMAISFHSIAAAINNLNEIHDLSFNQARTNCQNLWNQELNKINIRSYDTNILKTFYTALYHASLVPNLFNDLGEPIQYANFSIWDIFRSCWPLQTITQPKRIPDFINTMLRFYDEKGLLPVWDLENIETNCMTGYHVASLITESVLKGFTGFDVQKAYQALLKSANQPTAVMDNYLQKGFVPQDVNDNSVTLTLDYSYDDWCIAQLAKKLGKDDDYAQYMKRSLSYKNVYDPATGFLRAKNSLGQFYPNFDPFYSDVRGHQAYAEGTAWEYNWFVLHDIDGLVALHGGKNKFIAKLDSIWGLSEELHGDHPAIDISGMIGQYDQGNEPSHQTIYTYAALGERDKTAYWARTVCKKFYTPTPDGLPGNEDCGQMSAWYVFTALGFHPFCPADGKMYFGSPLITQGRIDLQNGKFLNIIVENNSEENKYISSIFLNGKLYDKDYIDYATLEAGGTLKMVMSHTAKEKYKAKP